MSIKVFFIFPQTVNYSSHLIVLALDITATNSQTFSNFSLNWWMLLTRRGWKSKLARRYCLLDFIFQRMIWIFFAYTNHGNLLIYSKWVFLPFFKGVFNFNSMDWVLGEKITIGNQLLRRTKGESSDGRFLFFLLPFQDAAGSLERFRYLMAPFPSRMIHWIPRPRHNGMKKNKQKAKLRENIFSRFIFLTDVLVE